MITILQLIKRYCGNHPLHNEFARLDPKIFRTVVCYLGGKDDGHNQIDQIADRVYYFGVKNGNVRWYNFSLVKQLAEVIDREGVHVVNCQLHRTVPIGVVAALRAAHKPLVLSTVHGLGGSSTFRRRIQNRLWHRFVHRIVTVSEAVRADVLAHNPALIPEKVETIHNGLRFDAFTQNIDDPESVSRKQKSISFGTVGRLSAVKNHETLIRAFARLLEQIPDATLYIAGRGELEEKLKDLTRQLRIEAKVVFLGFRSDIPDLLRQWDVFVFPSLREGLPLSLLEAMASGLPVIAANVGGIPEIFPSDPIGILVEPTDEDELTQAMQMLAQKTPRDLQVLGENARRRALEHFSAAGMVEKYQRLYGNVFEEWACRRGGRQDCTGE